MKKPKRSDYPNNRQGLSRFRMAERRYNKYIRESNKQNERKAKGYKDRPTWKKGESREDYRKRVLAWKQETKELDKKYAPKKKSRFELKHGRPNPNAKVNKKKEPYAKDRVGNVDLKSKAYLEAKRINESITLDDVNKKSSSGSGSGSSSGSSSSSESGNNTNKGPNLEAANQILKGNKKEVTYKDFESKETSEDKKKGSGKKESKWIRTRKGTLARRGSVTARAAENRERARKRAQAAAKERLKIKNKKKKKKD